ncbi:MAG: replication initiator protein A [Blautia sp.]|nr:replication initiator protein A [Blautia sp.]
MQKIQFDYFRGMEADQYSFYRVPKVLFTAECFKSLSCEAKVLYGLMLDRMSLSIKNRWFDEEDRVYIIFTVEEIMELLGCGRQKAIRNIAELDSEKGIGLIEKRRLGLGKPNVIYVKNFILRDCPSQNDKEKSPESIENTQKYENQTSGSSEIILQEVPESNFKKCENQTSGSMKIKLQEVPKSNFKKCENQTSGSSKIILPEVRKSNCNNTDINNTDHSETDIIQSYPISSFSDAHADTDVIEEMGIYRELIREHIGYESYSARPADVQTEVDELVELMVDVMMMPDDSLIKIAGSDKPVSIIKNRFMKLNYSHMEYVLFCLKKNTSKVGNIKAYLLTVLYNSTLTINNFFQAEVNHDMYGGG